MKPVVPMAFGPIEAPPLPGPLRHLLLRYMRWRRGVAWTRAIGWAFAFAVYWTIGQCLVDRVFRLSSPVRWTLWSIELIATLSLLLPVIWRWATRRHDWATAADELERRDPTLDGRLQTLVSQWNQPWAYRASEDMLQALLNEVERHTRQLHLAKLVPWRKSALAGMALVAGVVVAFWLSSIDSIGMRALLARNVTPWTDVAPVTTTRLAVTPGDTALVAETAFTVRVRASQLPPGERPMIHVRLGEHDDAEQPMHALANGDFQSTFATVDQPMEYFVSGGDALSPTYHVNMKVRPVVEQITVRCFYPDYLHRAPSEGPVERSIEAPVSTQMDLCVKANEPLQGGSVMISRREIPLEPTEDPTVRQARIGVTRSAFLRVSLVSAEGVESDAPTDLRLVAIPTRAPVAHLDEPDVDPRVAPDAVVDLQCSAVDELAVSRMGLQVQVNDGPHRFFPLPPQVAVHKACVSVALDLAALQPLQPGDQVWLWVEATNLVNQTAMSEPRLVQIVRHPVSLQARDRLDALQAAVAAAQSLRTTLLNFSRASESIPADVGNLDPTGMDPSEPDSSGAEPTTQDSADPGILADQVQDAAANAYRSLLGVVPHCRSPREVELCEAWLDDLRAVQSAMETAGAAARPSGSSAPVIDTAGVAEVIHGLSVLADGASDDVLRPLIDDLRDPAPARMTPRVRHDGSFISGRRAKHWLARRG